MTSGRASPARANTLAISESKSLSTTRAPSLISLSPKRSPPFPRRTPSSKGFLKDALCLQIHTRVKLQLHQSSPAPAMLRLLQDPNRIAPWISTPSRRHQNTLSLRFARHSRIHPSLLPWTIQLLSQHSTEILLHFEHASLTRTAPTRHRHRGSPEDHRTGRGRCLPKMAPTRLITKDILRTRDIKRRTDPRPTYLLCQIWMMIDHLHLPSTALHPVARPMESTALASYTRVRRL